MHGSLLNTLNILAILGAHDCTKCMPTDGCTAHTELNVEGWTRRMDRRCVGDAVETWQVIWEAAPTVCLVFVLNSGRQVAVQTPLPEPTPAPPPQQQPQHTLSTPTPLAPPTAPALLLLLLLFLPLLFPPRLLSSELLHPFFPQTPHLCFAS